MYLYGNYYIEIHMYYGGCDVGVNYCTCQFVSFVGELAELKADLQSDKKERKKEAVKKIIASMTVGKDVRLLHSCSTNLPYRFCVHILSHYLAMDTRLVNTVDTVVCICL